MPQCAALEWPQRGQTVPARWSDENGISVFKGGWETDHADRLTLRTIWMSSWIRFGAQRRRRTLAVARPDLGVWRSAVATIRD